MSSSCWLLLATLGSGQQLEADTLAFLAGGISGRFPYSDLTCSHSSIMTSWTEDTIESLDGKLVLDTSVDEVLGTGSSPSLFSIASCLKRERNFCRLACSLSLHLCSHEWIETQNIKHTHTHTTQASMCFIIDIRDYAVYSFIRFASDNLQHG